MSKCLFLDSNDQKVLSCVGRGLCEGLITRPEESYRVVCMCVNKKPRKGRKVRLKLMKVIHANILFVVYVQTFFQ
jgi:hypothetical protein